MHFSKSEIMNSTIPQRAHRGRQNKHTVYIHFISREAKGQSEKVPFRKSLVP